MNRTIVITAPYFPPHGGGLERYVYEIAVRLHKDYQWRIVVITSGEHGSKQSMEEMDGLVIYRLPYDWKISNTPFSFKWFGWIKSILKTEKPDIMNIHTPVPGIGDIAALMAGKIPVIVTYHAGSMRKKQVIPNIAIWLYEHGPLKILLGRANQIICSSDFVRNDFLRKYMKKSITITPGVDMDRFKPGTKRVDDNPTVLFVAGLGRAEQHKGLLILIDAIKILHEKLPTIRLKIVGEGDMRPEYEKRIHDLGIGSITTFTGRLGGQALTEAYEQSDILVLPSLAPAESFGMVLIEAMAAGVSVIGSNVGGIPTVIDNEKNGLLVPMNDPKALAIAIERVITNPGLKKQFSENALNKVKHQFLWETQAKKYDEFFKTLHP